MSNYNYADRYLGVDTLPDNDPDKIISGDGFHAEFSAIETAVNSKADSADAALTGTTTVQTLTVSGSLSAASPDFTGTTTAADLTVSGSLSAASPAFTGTVASDNLAVGASSTGGRRLRVEGDTNSNAYANIVNSAGGNATLGFGDSASDTVGYVQYVNSNDSMRFGVGGQLAGQFNSLHRLELYGRDARADQVLLLDPGYLDNVMSIRSNATDVKLQLGLLNASNTADLELYSNGTGNICLLTDNTERLKVTSDLVSIYTNFNVTGAFTSRGIDDNATSTILTLANDQKVSLGNNAQPSALAGSAELAVSGVTGSFHQGVIRLGNSAGGGGVTQIFGVRSGSAELGSIICTGNFRIDAPAIQLDVNGGSLNFQALPTSSAGLSTGDVWNDSGTLKIV